jgi:hypothetical protein
MLIEFKSIYTELRPLVQPYFSNHINSEEYFNCVLKSSFAKAFEFNEDVLNEELPDNSFFKMASLRSICEDLITLKFLLLKIKEDKNEVVRLFMMREVLDNISVQNDFFKKNKPNQNVVGVNNIEELISNNSDQLKKIWKKHGLNAEKEFPKITHMATDAGLIKLYNYLYSATSKLVHFSPHNLLRMGWTQNKKSDLHHFSVNHFKGYYHSFNIFYGSYLFNEFVNTFKNELKINKEVLKLNSKLKVEIDKFQRWPELVTFEEMNMVRPKPSIIDILFRSTEQLGGDK